MISTSKITNAELKVYKEEYDKLLKERERVNLQIEAILTTAALKLDKQYNTNRLDYAHLSNAYSVFSQNDLESMQFKIVDITIRDLFLNDSNDYEFITMTPYESGAYEFMYRYLNRTISIKIPTASDINKDNLDKLDWGVITVYEVLKSTDVAIEKVIIVQSDDPSIISSSITAYLTPPTLEVTEE